ncbi:hypothetical protein DPMN_029671 [Dreissena polymorpha]|uniref:Uncharacterized protein n=1 Tax=Dreissena polymorpha TaxID=45954 RepID=A0A9D4LZH1_DREPO|nr:hypothetical protein DPMN_029671 [Dreissena polymorpha]
MFGSSSTICKKKTQNTRNYNKSSTPEKLTLPQLKLMVVVVGARLADHLRSSLNIEDIIYWSDSQIVLFWF